MGKIFRDPPVKFAIRWDGHLILVAFMEPLFAPAVLTSLREMGLRACTKEEFEDAHAQYAAPREGMIVMLGSEELDVTGQPAVWCYEEHLLIPLPARQIWHEGTMFLAEIE